MTATAVPSVDSACLSRSATRQIRVLTRDILSEFPGMRIVAITSAQGHAHARRAFDDGVRGYLSKAAPRRELVRAIRAVHAGGRMIPGPLASGIAGHLTEEALTPREIQIAVTRGVWRHQEAM